MKSILVQRLLQKEFVSWHYRCPHGHFKDSKNSINTMKKLLFLGAFALFAFAASAQSTQAPADKKAKTEQTCSKDAQKTSCTKGDKATCDKSKSAGCCSKDQKKSCDKSKSAGCCAKSGDEQPKAENVGARKKEGAVSKKTSRLNQGESSGNTQSLRKEAPAKTTGKSKREG